MDLSKLTPADEFEMVIDCDSRKDHTRGTQFWACTPDRDTREEASADAELHTLARNAFDVMMRRGWTAERFSLLGGGFSWRIPMVQANDMIRQHGADAAEFKSFAILAKWPDPFTALVEADRWYATNVEGK